MSIDWSLAAKPANPLQVLQSLALGQQQRQQQLERQRIDSARNLSGEFFRAQNGGPASASPVPPVASNVPSPLPNALPSSSEAPGAGVTPSAAGLARLGMGQMSQTSTPSVGAAGRPGRAELNRLSYVDPKMAFDLQEQEMKSRKAELELNRDVNNSAIRILSSVHDQASYDAAKANAARVYGRIGFSLDDLNLPDAYDPDNIRDLRMRALDTDKQLAAELQERRLEWDQEDDEADNARADRDTDSRIVDRTERRGLTERGQNLSDSRGRRGQDIASEDRRRGQDLTDRRGRDASGRRRAPREPSTNGPVKVKSKADYDRLPKGQTYIAPDGTTKRKL